MKTETSARGLSQAYLSQSRMAAHRHTTARNCWRGSSASIQVSCGRSEGITRQACSRKLRIDAKIDSWLFAGAVTVSQPTPTSQSAPAGHPEHEDSRRANSASGGISGRPELAERSGKSCNPTQSYPSGWTNQGKRPSRRRLLLFRN